MAKLFIRISLVVIILAGGGFCAKKLADMKEPPEVLEAKESPLTVEAVRVAFGAYPVTVSGYGSARSAQRVSISPEVGGRVVHVHDPLEAGEIVAAQAVLFRIDPRTYQLRLDGAHARIKALEAQVARVTQQQINDRDRLKIIVRSREISQSRFDRLKRLYQEQEVGTLSEVEAAESTLTAQENQVAVLENALALYPRQLAELEASLLSAQVDRETAALDLERTEIKAPFRGRLTRVAVELGQNLIAGQPVLTLVNDELLEIPVSLDSMEVRRWLLDPSAQAKGGHDGWYTQVVGAEATIEWTGAPGEFSWPGKIDRVEAFNPETRTLMAVVRPQLLAMTLEATSALPLAEGMFCTVDFPSRAPVQCIRVPRTAVSHEGTVNLARENRLHTLPVEVVSEDADFALIRGELEEDQIIIITKLVDPLEGRLLHVVFPEPEREEPAQ